MVFRVIKSSDWSYSKKIKINTLEELIEFKNKCDYDIIISKFDDDDKECKYIIEIYDDWRE